MRARFIGDPNDNFSGPNVLESYGETFVKNEWASVPETVARKLASHSHFEVQEAADPNDLNSLKVAELKAIAEDRGVDLGDATKKADIIAALELAAEAEGEGA